MHKNIFTQVFMVCVHTQCTCACDLKMYTLIKLTEGGNKNKCRLLEHCTLETLISCTSCLRLLTTPLRESLRGEET